MTSQQRPCINIFKLNKAYYFKHFFDDPELFRELEPYYEKASYRFKMASAGARNKVMKLLDRKGFDPNIIEDAAPYTVEIGKYQNYGELLKSTQPRQAALKAANRSKGTKSSPAEIRLRERGTKKIHIFKGWRALVSAPKNKPSWMPDKINKPNVKKAGVEKLKKL